MKIASIFVVFLFSSIALAADDSRERFEREYKPESAHLAAIKRGLIGDITTVDVTLQPFEVNLFLLAIFGPN